MELSIGANNLPALTIRTGVLEDPKVIKTPTMEELIAIATAYNTGVNRNHQIVISTGIDGSTPVTSRTRDIYGGSVTSYVCPIPLPPSGCIWKESIGNIRQNTTPNFRKYSKFNAPIDRILTNYSIFPSVRSQILHDGLSDSSIGGI